MDRPRPYDAVGRDLLTGAVVFLPLVLIALLVVSFSGVVRRLLSRIGRLLAVLGIHGLLASLLAVIGGLLGFLLLLVAVGAVLRHQYGEWLFGRFDAALTGVPGVGPFYQEFRRARRLLIGDRAAFRTVVTVELAEGVDVLAFVVAREGDSALGRPELGADRVTVFVPLSPNPLAGGHLIAVERDRLSETDLTVRAALATLLTVGSDEAETAEPPLSGLYHQRGTDRSPEDDQSPDEPPAE